MIALDQICLRFGQQILFDQICAQINPHDRIGLVGPNGAGKSTLLKILLGSMEFDGGRVEIAKGVEIGYLPQDAVVAPGRTLYAEAESAFTGILELRQRHSEASEALATLAPDSPAYAEQLELMGEIQHRLEEHEEDKMPAKIKKVLLGLGFREADLQTPCEAFSGGWQMRIALAKLLLREPSLLMLDEPTNHLDMPSLRWLEHYLQRYDGALLLVSHDRAFLDSLCTRMFALARGQLEVYAGNYSYFEKESAIRREHLLAAQKSQEKQIAQTERFVERFRYKSTKARQVQSRIKALDKIERIEVEEELDGIHFRFPPPPRSGESVIRLAQIHKSYGDIHVFKGLDLEIERGQKVALIGPNGAGKSTLTRILAGTEPFQSGQRIPGVNVTLSFFAQHQADELDPQATVLESAEHGAVPAMRPKVRDILGAFLFRGDAVFKKTSVLSGGEKNRLALARMLLRPGNFLIFDEPTNHLDMRSKSILQEALKAFEGTLLIVSHDRFFLEPVVSRIIDVQPGKVREYPGKLSAYLEKLEAEEAAANSQANSPKTPSLARHTGETQPHTLQQNQSASANANSKERRRLDAQRRQRLAPLRKRAEELENSIADAEIQIAQWETRMKDPLFFKRGSQTQADIERYEHCKRKLESDMQEWEMNGETLAQLEQEHS